MKMSMGVTGTAEAMRKVGSSTGMAGDGGDSKYPFQKQVGLMSSDTGPLASNDRQGTKNAERVERYLP